MNRRRNSLFITHKWITLYKEDIIEIYKIMKSINGKVKLEVNEYENLESIEEIDKIETYMYDKIVMTVSKDSDTITITLDSESRASIFTTNDSDAVIYGCMAKINDLLKKRYSKLSKWIYCIKNQALLFVILELILAVVAVYLVWLKNSGKILSDRLFDSVYYGTVIVGLLFYPYTVLIEKMGRGECQLFSSSKKKNPGFFRRNKDEILISIVSTIIGMFLGLCVSWVQG